MLVAHEYAFQRLLREVTLPASLSWVCTHKAELHVWLEALRHSDQVRRGWRKPKLDPALTMPSHRAYLYAYVTAHLLADLLSSASVEQVIQ